MLDFGGEEAVLSAAAGSEFSSLLSGFSKGAPQLGQAETDGSKTWNLQILQKAKNTPCFR